MAEEEGFEPIKFGFGDRQFAIELTLLFLYIWQGSRVQHRLERVDSQAVNQDGYAVFISGQRRAHHSPLAARTQERSHGAKVRHADAGVREQPKYLPPVHCRCLF